MGHAFKGNASEDIDSGRRRNAFLHLFPLLGSRCALENYSYLIVGPRTKTLSQGRARRKRERERERGRREDAITRVKNVYRDICSNFFLSFFFFFLHHLVSRKERKRKGRRKINFLFCTSLSWRNVYTWIILGFFFFFFSEIRWIVVLDLRLDIFYRCKEIHFI